MATQKELQQAKWYHSLTFFVPPAEDVFSSNNYSYNESNDFFTSQNSISSSGPADQYATIYTNPSAYNVGSNPKNTWYDWHLVPCSRPVINPPSIVTKYVEIPGLNGYLDLTNALTDHVTGAREGSIQFYVMNDYGNWEERYNQLLAYIHGNELRVILDDNPRYYYQGRWAVEEWTNNNDGICSSVSFSYHLQPGRRPV